MKKRKALLIVLTLMMIVMAFVFTACEYGQPDKLNIGKISVGERILIGLQVALIGMVMVFVVLIMLIGFIDIIKYFCIFLESDKNFFKRKKKNKNVAEPSLQAIGSTCEDDEIAVAITAALIAYYENQNIDCHSELPFKVRSIKQIKNKI